MRKHRSDAADDWLIEEYLKAVSDLTIYKQNEAKLQALHNELLETKVAQQNKDSEMKELKEQIEEIRYLYQSPFTKEYDCSQFDKCSKQ